MKASKILFLFLSVAFLFSSCERKISSYEELTKWMNEEENGFVKIKDVGGIELQVKYLPSEFLVSNEIVNGEFSEKDRDSLTKFYNTTRTFLLSVGPNKKGGEIDIMKAGVSDMAEYTERAMELNFNMAEYIELTVGGKHKYKPVLANLENVYGLSNHRNFYLVFAPDEKDDLLFKEETLVLTFRDEIFETGINHFEFSKMKIDGLPEVKFKN